MAHKHVQGQNINLLIGGSVIAASESCDFSLSANTSDAAAKDDPGLGEWDNPTFENYSWSGSNSSYVVDVDDISDLLGTVTSDAKVTVVFNVNAGTGGIFALTGDAIITSFEIDAPADGKAKINISLEGCTPLSTVSNPTAPTPASTIASRIKGKALMMAVRTGSSTYATAMCATGHKFSISVQTSDITDKDSNDSFVYKEVTGRSFTLSTDNMVPTYDATDEGIAPTAIMSMLMGGTHVELRFSYYASSIGNEATKHNWGDVSTESGSHDAVLVEGKYICTSFQMNGQVKSQATYSATFQGIGAPTISA